MEEHGRAENHAVALALTVAAVDAFKASLEKFTIEQLVAVDASSIVLKSLLEQPKNFVAREAGVTVVQAVVEKFGAQCVSAFFQTVQVVLQLVGDKKSGSVRELSEKVSVALFKAVPASVVPVYVTKFLIEGDDAAFASLSRWQTKVCALKILSAAAEKAPREIEAMMTTLVPVLSDMMWDTRKQVQTQSADTLEDICDSIDNIDLEPFIPSMVEAIQKPDTVPDCVYALAGTTFVQTVTASALSITVPILERGFKERKTAIKRKCAVITENMAKLAKDLPCLAKSDSPGDGTPIEMEKENVTPKYPHYSLFGNDARTNQIMREVFGPDYTNFGYQ